MKETSIKTLSMQDLKDMKSRGELFHDAHAVADESLGAEFWAKAVVQSPPKPRSVHLKLDPDVFEFFVAETKGKGHLTRMQEVLKAYMRARLAS